MNQAGFLQGGFAFSGRDVFYMGSVRSNSGRPLFFCKFNTALTHQPRVYRYVCKGMVIIKHHSARTGDIIWTFSSRRNVLGHISTQMKSNLEKNSLIIKSSKILTNLESNGLHLVPFRPAISTLTSGTYRKVRQCFKCVLSDFNILMEMC